MSSYSSTMLTAITSFRNPNGQDHEWPFVLQKKNPNPLSVIAAEVGLILMVPFALVEAAFAAIARLASLFLPLSEEKCQKIAEWQTSSAYSVIWAAVDVVINPFMRDVVTSERVVRVCIAKGHIFSIPPEVFTNKV